MLKRILFFLGINIAVIVVLNIVLSVFNVQPYLTPYGINYQSLLIFAAVIGFTGAFISLAISKWMAKRTFGIQPIDPGAASGDEAKIYQMVQSLAEKANIGMPEVGIYKSPEPNAFATGMSRNNALVAVSTGLLQVMDRPQVEAVLTHEVAHIQNGDMITMTLLQGVINTFVIFFARIAAHAVQTFTRQEFSYIAYIVTSIVFEILFGILASVGLMAFSRVREYAADAGSARLIGSPQPMIAALQTLEKVKEQGVVDERGESFSTMKIADNRRSWLNLWRSHPTTADRVAALQKSE